MAAALLKSAQRVSVASAPFLAVRQTVRLVQPCAKASSSVASATSTAKSALEHSRALGRPLSPDLLIYQPQLPWVMSGAFRVSAGVMTAGVYAGVALYVAGGHDAAWYVDQVQSLGLPFAAIFAGKLILVGPVSYHIFNGIRHLVWDTGRFMTTRGVYQTGWVVLALTAVTSVALALQ